MRTSRIHVATALVSGAEMVLTGAASNYLLRVLRLRPGAPLTLFNGAGGEYQATLLVAEQSLARVRVGAHVPIERESPLHLTLLQGISRGERMDLIVQKATELGVTRIVPVTTAHSVVRLDARQADRRREHWQGIAISACEQSGRNRIPELGAIAGLEQACAELAASEPRLLLSPTATMPLRAIATGLRTAVLLIGPEGGLSDAEEQLATQHGFNAYRLGPRVLRTETAPLAAITLLQIQAGDLGA
jgi:16S rRNA (uracil1498-N3)-methyltransferase